MAKNCDSVLKLLDFNINMFSKYENDHAKQLYQKMLIEKEEILRMQRGEIEYKDMSYGAKENFFEMPNWGTKGT